jgi:hypothetical protein
MHTNDILQEYKPLRITSAAFESNQPIPQNILVKEKILIHPLILTGYLRKHTASH